MILKNEKIFIKELVNTFPEIKQEILEDWAGSISLQIGCFRRFTQNAIEKNDKGLILKCFQFVEDNIGAVEFKVENSLVISWLGKLNFEKNEEIFELLSPNLKELFHALQKHYSEPSKDKKLNTFLKNIDQTPH